MIDQVASHAVVALQLGRDEDLRADAVGRTHEQPLFIAWKLEKTAKAPDRP